MISAATSWLCALGTDQRWSRLIAEGADGRAFGPPGRRRLRGNLIDVSENPPIIVLSGHRTGSSAVVGILAACGAHIGTPLPPSIDNPRGYFENALVVRENSRMLGQLDRDWTCPPHRWRAHGDEQSMRTALSDAQGLGGVWAIKDPRMLFALESWLPLVEAARFVGVDRSVLSVAKSIHTRDGIDINAARAIAQAHSARLHALADELRFPVVEFGTEGMIEGLKAVVTELGLVWEPRVVDDFYDRSLIHHGRSPGAADRVELSRTGSTQTHQRDVIRRAIKRAEDQDIVPLRLDQGPTFQQRTRELVQICLGSTTPGRVAVVADPAARIPGLDLPDVTRISPQEFLDLDGAKFSHVVGPMLLDHVDPANVPQLLSAIERNLDPAGMAALSGLIAEEARVPSSVAFSPTGVMASRFHPPYLQRRDEIELLLTETPFHLLDMARSPGGRTNVRLGRDPRMRASGVRSPDELRTLTSDLEAALRMAEEESRRQGEALRDLQIQLAKSDERNSSLEADLIGTQQRLEVARSTAAEQRDRGDRHAENARALQARLDQSIEQVTQLKHRVRRLDKDLNQATRKYDRLAGRRSVRTALGLAKLAGPLFRIVRSLRRRRTSVASAPSSKAPASTPREDRRSASEVIRDLRTSRPGPDLRSGPLVSIVILTRDGAHHLERLLPKLASTTYRSFEVIAVDNDSSDHTRQVLEKDWGFPVQTVYNRHNASFSEGNNQAVERANGELLLFLNNDLEPINDGWLGAMVETMRADPAPAAVGALLVYPERGEPDTDLTVQHRGVGFGFRDGAPHAFNLGHPDPTDTSLVETVEVPAVTAAAMMCDKKMFARVGGFTVGYVYGTEDVDLCIKLRELGHIVMTGGAVMFHHESATQRTVVPDVVRINRMGNWQRFAETWGPRLSRSIVVDRLSAAGRWTGRPSRTVAITLTADDESKGWGDYYTAHQLGDAFREQGWTVVYAERFQERWYELDDSIDLIVSLLDSYDVRQAPSSAFTIAWVRNWVDRWTEHPWFEDFDMVVASSHKAADVVAANSKYDPPVLPLAANPALFHPGSIHPTFRADITFTGNNWGAGRKIIPLLDIHPEETFMIFGKNWDKDPRMKRYWRGHLPYSLLPDLYRSVKIVLDDTAGPTLPHAFVNGRVFEALAAGALVLTDNAEGSEELFDGLLPTYADRFELRRQLDRFLADDDLRSGVAEELRRIVIESHTYTKRASQFVDLALAEVRKPVVGIKIGVPREDEAHRWGDFHFAQSMGRALSHQGFRSEVHLLGQWDDPSNQDIDVALHIRGLTTYAPKQSHVNVLWIISHPEDVSPEECRKYDLVFVASKRAAAQLSENGIDAKYLPQATDAARFGAAASEADLRSELLFVGNSRGQERVGVRWSLEESLPLTLYGADWGGLVDDTVVAGEYFPNERLGSLYASAGVVLNDHWPDMREWGLVSNRVFDVLASGGVVVSDRVEGLRELFGELVPTYGSPAELKQVVTELLENPEARQHLIEQARQLVLAEHTFDARAQVMADALWPLLAGRPMDCDQSSFTHDLSPEPEPARGRAAIIGPNDSDSQRS